MTKTKPGHYIRLVALLALMPGAAAAQQTPASVEVAQAAPDAQVAAVQKKKPKKPANKANNPANANAGKTVKPPKPGVAANAVNNQANKPVRAAKKPKANPAQAQKVAPDTAAPVVGQVPAKNAAERKKAKQDKAPPVAAGNAGNAVNAVNAGDRKPVANDAAKPGGVQGKPDNAQDAQNDAARPGNKGPNAGNKNAAANKGAAAKRPDTAVAKKTFVAPPATAQRFDDLKKSRVEKTSTDGKTRVIVETDKRVIVKQDNRVIIRNNESDRFSRVARGAKTTRKSDGSVETVYVRADGISVYNVVDNNGRILYRYRKERGGREVVLIDNRRSYRSDRSDRNRDLAIGLGVGVAVGALIVLAPPVITIPREQYIVDYGRATDDDLYEALSAPPVERLERSYTLDEIRYNAPLRERMRRVDVDTVTFEFGSWEVTPSQYSSLERIAAVINRALDRNSGEIFLIEGHSDAVGSEEDNLVLSDRRAQSVAEILTSSFDVPPENLVTQGYGEQQLKVDTQEAERGNRRIAFRRVTPLLSEQTQTQ